ncbi:uncharacterized protein LOC119381403 [Rhipicephalus sanguineus]|uniref:uncharacterized protein LOC119381403 n=1 Tax=Rhipicephalus sanguineus TaxID=34632 RepID=UPI0020C51BDD|nr:uncharacterized protein LOC119381403 [Rhipicephalus sanguineus]
MARVLKAFVLWNAVSLLWCCGGNLVGLRYPPKWLYYTNILYDFYRTYETSGDSSVAAPLSVHVEGSRMSEGRTTGEVTAQSLFKSAETTIKTRSQALGPKLRRQPVDPAEDCTNTILLAGTMTAKSGGRTRRHSVATAEDGTTTIAGKKSGKTGGRLRRQSRGPAEDCTTTILPAMSKSSKMSGRSRKQSVAGVGRANVTAKAVKPPAATSKVQPVTTTAASRIRKPATQGSRRQSIFGASGIQTDGKKSRRQSIGAAAGASATADTTRKSGSRRQSVDAGTLGRSSVGSTPPLQTSRRQSAAGATAPAVAQLVAARKARRRSLRSEDAAGIAAFAASKKPTGQSRRQSITAVETKDALQPSDTSPLCPGSEDRL